MGDIFLPVILVEKTETIGVLARVPSGMEC